MCEKSLSIEKCYKSNRRFHSLRTYAAIHSKFFLNLVRKNATISKTWNKCSRKMWSKNVWRLILPPQGRVFTAKLKSSTWLFWVVCSRKVHISKSSSGTLTRTLAHQEKKGLSLNAETLKQNKSASNWGGQGDKRKNLILKVDMESVFLNIT